MVKITKVKYRVKNYLPTSHHFQLFIILESMRKWPIVGTLPRTCTKDYELPPFEGGPKRAIGIKRGNSVHVAVGAFHRDPQYFSSPEKFDPSRFFEGSTESFTKEAFFPWGAGPRYIYSSSTRFNKLKLY